VILEAVTALMRGVYALSGAEITVLCGAAMLFGMVVARWLATGWRK
jgi:hypothetical protein